MIPINYIHSWGSGMNDEEERALKFGELLHEEDTADSYEVEQAHLYKNGEDVYNFLEANGCSCWDGDYDGWQFTKEELMTWATANAARADSDYRERSDVLVAKWVIEHKDEL